MTDILYEDELKKTLVEYKQITDQMDELKAKKDQIRNQIKQWLGINNLTEHCIYDENEQCWKISFGHTTRRGIADWGELRLKLGSDFDDYIKITESNTFLVKQVKRPS